jgi:hypothetical protein
VKAADHLVDDHSGREEVGGNVPDVARCVRGVRKEDDVRRLDVAVDERLFLKLPLAVVLVLGDLLLAADLIDLRLIRVDDAQRIEQAVDDRDRGAVSDRDIGQVAVERRALYVLHQ